MHVSRADSRHPGRAPAFSVTRLMPLGRPPVAHDRERLAGQSLRPMSAVERAVAIVRKDSEFRCSPHLSDAGTREMAHISKDNAGACRDCLPRGRARSGAGYDRPQRRHPVHDGRQEPRRARAEPVPDRRSDNVVSAKNVKSISGALRPPGSVRGLSAATPASACPRPSIWISSCMSAPRASIHGGWP
jgi:hypothetical protein